MHLYAATGVARKDLEAANGRDTRSSASGNIARAGQRRAICVVKGDRSGDRAKGGMKEKKRKSEKIYVPRRSTVVANESEELTVERTGQDRERETD